MTTHRSSRWDVRFPRIRDGAALLIGSAGVIHETFLTHLDRPYLLTLFGGMVLAPAFMKADQKADQRRRQAAESDSQESP